MSNTINIDNPTINSEADARAWLEALLGEEGGTAHLPNPDNVREEMGNGYFGAFAHLTEEGVRLIRQTPTDEDEGQALLAGVALVQAGASRNAALERVWEVVDDPHALANDVESRRPVRDLLQPLLRTFGDVEAWFRALVVDKGVVSLPRRSFAELGLPTDTLDDDDIALLDLRLAEVRSNFADVDVVFARVLVQEADVAAERLVQTIREKAAA